jgi:hypothetical protein
VIATSTWSENYIIVVVGPIVGKSLMMWGIIVVPNIWISRDAMFMHALLPSNHTHL